MSTATKRAEPPLAQSPSSQKRSCLTATIGSVAIGATLGIQLFTLPAYGQTTKASDEEIRQKYRQAYATFKVDKKPEEALKLFMDLWNKVKSHDIAASIGEIELSRKRYPEAAQYLNYAIAMLPPYQSEKQLTALRKSLQECQKHVGTYELSANVKGAVVNLDGVDVGKTPLDGPLFLSPGWHILLVTMDGYKRGDKSVNVSAGASEKLDVQLVPVEAEKPVPAAPAASPLPQPNLNVTNPPPPVESAPAKPNPWILVGGGVVTVGGIVTGLVFNSKANSYFDKAQTTRARTGPTGCDIGGSANLSDCASTRENLKDGDNARNLSRISFAIGGAALIGTVAYWLWPRNAPAASNAKVVAVASPYSSWVGISGTF
jgi:hypothetical protein